MSITTIANKIVDIWLSYTNKTFNTGVKGNKTEKLSEFEE